jgi:hypothetical protein
MARFGAVVNNAHTRTLVRKYTNGNMTSQITILRGSLSALDPTTGLVSGIASPTTIYTGKARIRTVSGAGPVTTEGGPIDTRRTTISIPMTSAIPFRDDIITVQAANQTGDGVESDHDLDHRVFRVVDVDGGSFFGDARRMSCTQVYDSRYWSST